MTNFGINSPEGQERIVGVAVSPGAAASTVLTADGAGGTSWAAGGGAQPVGEQAGTPATGDITGSTLAQAALTLPTPPDTTFYFGGDTGASDWYGFLPVYSAQIVTGLQINVASSSGHTSGKKVRLALYSADEAFQPVALLGQTGELDVDSVAEGAWLSGSIAADIILEPGNYLIAGSSDDAGDQVWYPAVDDIGPVWWPDGQTDTSLCAIFRDRGYGPFPATLDPWTDAEVNTDGDSGKTTVPAALVTRSGVVVLNPSAGQNIVSSTSPALSALELRGIADQIAAVLSISTAVDANSPALKLAQADANSLLLQLLNLTFSPFAVGEFSVADDGTFTFTGAGMSVAYGSTTIDEASQSSILVGPDADPAQAPQIDLYRIASYWFVLRAMQGPQAIPDTGLGPRDIQIYFDPTNGAAKLKFKGKTIDGTVVTGEVALSA